MDFEAFFQMSYGLYIITSIKDGQKNGYIGNTAFQVTATPPQIGISVNRDNYTHTFIEQSGLFGLSVLTQDARKETIQTFGYKGGRDVDKFAGVQWKTTPSGLVLVTSDCSAVFECKVVTSLPVGTHTLFVGEVLSAEVLDPKAVPLTYEHYRKAFKAKSPQKAPTYVDETYLKKESQSMNKQIYICQVCNYEYDPKLGDPDSGIPPGTAFEDIPDDWVCPICGATKADFEPLG